MKVFEFKKNETLILKGIAILFVLLDHLEYYLLSGGGGVALFLLLSGYGINLSGENNSRGTIGVTTVIFPDFT